MILKALPGSKGLGTTIFHHLFYQLTQTLI